MYSTLVDTVCGSLTLELLTGDLKAVLSLLSDVREKMGQGKSKSKAHATADQTKLLPYDVIKLDVDSEQVGESQFQIEESQMSQNGVLITHSQPIARQRQHPIKVLTTFQGPQISQEPQRSGSITKSAINGSLSLMISTSRWLMDSRRFTT
ncbi:hypothetical protein EB796_004593 [Bugula neritina]|uniref:Uncharacterized protein n=1 Tax=Bugula neritina TaxID=10212 RepID=A0A7J7KFQ5_BUGNE|nr:hypothetical protein EB796_004593 [Bugula neritina]